MISLTLPQIQTNQTMNHNEYEKMPKGFLSYGFDERQSRELSKLKWVVTEKVHGANFSFVYADGALKYAKRKEFLAWTDDFFGFQTVVNEMEDRVLRMFEALTTQEGKADWILYGELFGGEYPHPEVAAVPDVQAIQTGVYYAPGIHFCAFDLAWTDAAGKHYLDYSTAERYFKEFGIFYAQSLFTGKLNEALQFNTRIPSTLPRQLGLPELTDNLIEGVVIKPWSHSSMQYVKERPIIKVKNAEFEEEKFHEAEKWSFIPQIESKAESMAFVVEEMMRYITFNRLESVISKIGRPAWGNEVRMNALQTEFLRDVLDDFNRDSGGIWEDLDDGQQTWVKDRLLHAIQKLMRDHFPQD